MQHPWPYLFVRLSEIASCSAYGNKVFKMKLSPRTKEFLWLSSPDFHRNDPLWSKSCSEKLLLLFSEARGGLGFERLLLTVMFLGKMFFFFSCFLQTSPNKV